MAKTLSLYLEGTETGMGWIVGVKNTGAELSLVESRDGAVIEVSARDADLDIEVLGRTRRTRFIPVDLEAFNLLDDAKARDLLVGLHCPESVAEVQSLFVFQDVSRAIVVPSQVVIRALAGTSRAHRSALLIPSGFQLMANIADAPDGPAVVYPKFFEGKSPGRCGGLSPTILWTSAYPSARRMHASVLRHALNGRFDIDLPKARVTISFSGTELPDGTLLATRIHVAAIEPLEPPMKHMEKAPTKFAFAEVDRRRLRTGTPADAPKGPRDVGKDPELADARFAMPLTDVEWDAVREAIASHRPHKRRLGHREREKVNLIVRKLCIGQPWTVLTGSAARAQLVRRYFEDLKANGSWLEVKRLVVTSRGLPLEDQLATADDERSAELQHLRTQVVRMTQQAFAALLGVSSSEVSRWERGIKRPQGPVAQKVRLLALGGIEALREQGT